MSRYIDADAIQYDEDIPDIYTVSKTRIDNMPTADVRENIRGEWIEFDSDEDKYDIIKCSCCKHIFTVDSYHWTDIGFVKDDFKYCPNCGADMRGDNHD